MAVQLIWGGVAMIKVGVLVEGRSDQKLIESSSFKNFFRKCKIKVVSTIPANGYGNLKAHKVKALIETLERLPDRPDKIILLADMNGAPCYTKRKKDFKHKGINLIIIAKQSIESWLLADTNTMRKRTGNKQFYEPTPENPDRGAWAKLQNALQQHHKKDKSKTKVAMGFVKCGFDIERAAKHKNCPSARYFVDKLRGLTKGK